MGRVPFAALALLAWGCGPGPSEPPTPIIQARPETLCEGDDFITPIHLDGCASTPGLELVPGDRPPCDAHPLTFLWELGGAEHRVVAGGYDQPRLSVTTAADRPLHVWLTVRDGDGEASTALRTIPIRLDCGGAAP